MLMHRVCDIKAFLPSLQFPKTLIYKNIVLVWSDPQNKTRVSNLATHRARRYFSIEIEGENLINQGDADITENAVTSLIFPVMVLTPSDEGLIENYQHHRSNRFASWRLQRAICYKKEPADFTQLWGSTLNCSTSHDWEAWSWSITECGLHFSLPLSLLTELGMYSYSRLNGFLLC